MKKLDLKFGGHPLKNNDFKLMQDAYAEAFKALISVFDPSLNTILSGFRITNDGTTISCEEGYISWQGEICKVDATSFAVITGQQLYLKLIEEVLPPSPVTYKDQTNQNVHINRKLQFKYYTLGDEGEYFAAFSRTSSLGFKRGMLLDYIGNVALNFDDTGLGINDMAGFAICNGNTYTITGGISYTVPDLRGKRRIGASNLPSNGAPAYNSLLGTFNFGSSDGDNFITLGQVNLPNYNLPITDTGHHHFTIVNDGLSSNSFPYEIGRSVTNLRSLINSYAKTSGGGKESYIFAGANSNFPAVQPTIGPTSRQTTGITVSLGGSGTPFSSTGAWFAGVPIIKL